MKICGGREQVLSFAVIDPSLTSFCSTFALSFTNCLTHIIKTWLHFLRVNLSVAFTHIEVTKWNWLAATLWWKWYVVTKQSTLMSKFKGGASCCGTIQLLVAAWAKCLDFESSSCQDHIMVSHAYYILFPWSEVHFSTFQTYWDWAFVCCCCYHHHWQWQHHFLLFPCLCCILAVA